MLLNMNLFKSYEFCLFNFKKKILFFLKLETNYFKNYYLFNENKTKATFNIITEKFRHLSDLFMSILIPDIKNCSLRNLCQIKSL